MTDSPLVSAQLCRANAAECVRLAAAANISAPLATALMSMSRSWTILEGDVDRYECILRAEADQASRLNLKHG